MKKAMVFVHNIYAADLIENDNHTYELIYQETYQGPPISLTLPFHKKQFHFNSFPAFFDGLLPEGQQLEFLLKHKKIDKRDYFKQLVTVGNDLVGAVTVVLDKETS